jgi:phage terminase small subunit
MPVLKDKYEKFCQAYVISRNATASAKEAGYSEKSAYNQGYELLKRADVKERIEELEGEYNTDVDVISELEKQYEQAKINGNGATALKALELVSRVRGNNAADNILDNIEGLEDRIRSSMFIIGKEKMYALFMQTFPEDFEEEEEYTDEEDYDILEELDDEDATSE